MNSTVMTTTSHINKPEVSTDLGLKTVPALTRQDDIDALSLDLLQTYGIGQVGNYQEAMPTTALPGANMTITYARRSSSKTDQGGSRERQEEDHEETVRKYGLPPIAHRFYDDGITGTTTERPSYQQAKNLVIANPGCVMVIEAVDRAVRSGAVGFDFGYFIIQHQVQLFGPKGRISSEELLEECAKASGVAKHIAERNLIARVKAIKRGVFFPEPPFGYTKPKTGILEIVPELAPVVRQIYQFYIEGRTYAQICRWLHDHGIANASGNLEWHTSTIRRILSNVIYIGWTVNKIPRSKEQWPVKTPHTLIVEPEVFAAVQTARRDNRGRPKGGSGNRTLLVGKTKCLVCGSTWEKWQSMGGHDVMRCRRTKWGCNGMPLVSRTLTEKTALSSLQTIIYGDGHQASFLHGLQEGERQVENARGAIRSNLDTMIAAEKAKIARAKKDAYDFGMTAQMADTLRSGEALVAELTERRNILLTADFVVPKSQRILSITGGLDFLTTNTPLQRIDSESEEMIAAIAAVISSVSLELLPSNEIRQTTVFDFNQPGDEAQQPELIRTVVKIYPQPLLDARSRQAQSFEQAMASKCFVLSQQELTVMGELDVTKRFFSAVSRDELQRGWQALALMVCGGFEAKCCFEAYSISPGSAFSAAYQRCRLGNDVKELETFFKEARPSAPNMSALSRRVRESGYIRAKLKAYGHPILNHPICLADGRTWITDLEWKAITSSMHRVPGFSGRKRMATTRRDLDYYFAVVRLGTNWLEEVPASYARGAQRRVRDLIFHGHFNQLCRIMLVQEGLLDPNDRSPLPEVPTEKVSLRKLEADAKS